MAGGIVSVERTGKVLVVTPFGDISTPTVSDLRQELRDLMKTEFTRLVLDFRNVKIMDSMGIGLIIATRNSLVKRNGHIQVTNVTNDIAELFKDTGLSQFISVTGAIT